MRIRWIAMGLALAVAAGGCGSAHEPGVVVAQETTPPTPEPTTPETTSPTPEYTTPEPTPTTTEPEVEVEEEGEDEGVFLGCHEYCQNAGGYGGDEWDGYVPVEISDDDITMADGMLPVTVECVSDDTCRGAIMISSLDPIADLGWSDLEVDGGETRTILVEVPEEGLDALSDEGSLDAQITADFGDPSCPGDSKDACTVSELVTAYDE